MKTVLSFILVSMIVTLSFADELYVWTDENGATQSSTTKPAGWNEEKNWNRVGTTLGTRQAAFPIPFDVYRSNRLGEAQKQARSTNAPIIFLYTNEHTSCSLAAAASLEVLRAFRDSGVIVYALSGDKDTWKKLPGIVRSAINSPAAGRFIPMTIVVNSEITEVISIIPYVRDNEARAERLHKVNAMISRR